MDDGKSATNLRNPGDGAALVGRSRSTKRDDRSGEPPMRKQLDLLIGDKRRLILALSACSIIAALTEAITLAVIAQVAASLVGHTKGGAPKISLLHVHASVSTLLWIAFALAGFRLFLQWPLSVLPARICAEGAA